MKNSCRASSAPPNHITFAEVKEQALSLGWDDVGITPASIPEEDIVAYRNWIGQQYHGNLTYMEKEMRCKPVALLPGAKTAILFISYYKQEKKPFRSDAGLIASYARGRKYHNVHHKRLKLFIHWLEKRSGEKNIAKGFSDSAPILEKALAVQAGLGWFGKSTLLIHRKFGTFTLLSGVLTTLAFPEATRAPRKPRCGSCRRCLDACPTQALVAPYCLDAKKCLSQHLIESKGALPDEARQKNPGYIFGCDICQDACPHNQRTPISQSRAFSPHSGMGTYLTKEQLDTLRENPEKLYGTPLQRRGVKGLYENAEDLFE